MTEERFLEVRVRSRQGLVFEGQAVAVTSENKKGVFDVLPRHANFICTIRKRLVIGKAGGEKETMNLEAGILHVYKNKVIVFLGVM
ncbi:hypothetical protein HYW29_01695 [Candidatus Amesbacteria bacterium]|nr:hypothetical protein [Candidatus Amesbacteria bacterium]